MSEASRFLTSVAQAVSTMSLYQEGHPARERALDAAHDRLQELQRVNQLAHFTFLGDEIVVDQRPLRDLRGWDWGTRFSGAGIQRLELLGPVERDDLEAFLYEASDRLSGVRANTAEARPGRPTNIRFGVVGLRDEDDGSGTGAERLTTATLGYTLKEEIDAVGWIHGELKDRKQLHLLEAESIVRSLSVAMHGDQAFVIPLLRMKRYDQYTTTHSMNVSILAMSLAEYIGLAPSEVRGFGISGLLHDMGKVTVPDDILNKPGRLTDDERAVMNRHPVEGARIILETEDQLDLAATVAYEHHIKLNGGGYPTLTYHRRCHQASDLVHVCDVFDALRTDRPYREAWATERVLSYLEEGAGAEFDPDLANAFVRMIRAWEGKVVYVDNEDTPVNRGGTGRHAPVGSGGASESGEAGNAGREAIDVTAIDIGDEVNLEELAEIADPGDENDDMSWE